MSIPRALRWTAIAIAVLAVIDPALTSGRSTRPEVALIAGDSTADAALIDRVARELDERFTVIPGPFAPAAATVLVGSSLPPSAAEVRVGAFGVIPEGPSPRATIEAVDAPPRAALDARVRVVPTIRVVGARGFELETTLRSGDAVVDRATRRVDSDDERRTIPLTFVPVAAAAVPLSVTARVTAGAGPAGDRPATADLVVDVRDDRWAVLFFDPRPSWISTFVRRSVERDPRFVVTSRVMTSRNVSIDAGRPPAALGDPQALELFDAIVVGGAQALSARDVAGLETFLRRRGGAVVLLLDERANGAHDRLTGVSRWTGNTSAVGFTIASSRGDSAALRATTVAWPTALPPGARPLATISGPGAVADRPVVWRSSVGAGQLVVSGALDAWRHRDPAQSGFDRFWRSTIADAAAAGATSIEVALAPDIAAPGERMELTATIRALALADPATARAPRDSMTARLDAPDGSRVIRLHADGESGRYVGSFRAPSSPGIHRVAIAGNGAREDVALVVSGSPARPRPDESQLVAAWVASRGGRSFDERALADLRPALEAALRPAARPTTWYPMRSAWWIVPFALLLGAEWLWRRRRGLA